ncbi:hypothetical protein SAMN02910339_02920 [Lachnospiraceae bacterium YSD2013]|nr:hypothetical protein SAMN02910339_02920 [Lachnospiraceae bacterium YSD2013]
MILPVNTNPSIITYAHHSFPLAIIEQGLAKSLVSFRANIEGDDLNIRTLNDVTVSSREGYIELWAGKYAQNTECFMLKECGEDESLEIEICEYRKDMSGVLNLILCTKDYAKCASENKYIYRVGKMLGRGIINAVDGEYRDSGIGEQSGIECKKLKISRKGNKLATYAYVDDNWKQLLDETLPEEMVKEGLLIGVNGNMGRDQFYNWKYMNYTQISYGEEDAFVWLDYYLYPRKCYSFNHTQQFLDIFHVPIADAKELFGGDIFKAFIWFLSKGYYLEIPFDEYYINNRAAYMKNHFLHNSMVYGYSEDETQIYGLGYSNKVMIASITKEDVALALDQQSAFKLYRYRPDVKTFEFNLRHYIKVLEDFVESRDTGDDFSTQLVSNKYLYGISALKALLEREHGRNILTHDQRTGYFLHEHASIMRERLDYFLKTGILNNEEFTELTAMCDDLLGHLVRLKNLIYKNIMKENYNETIIERMETIVEAETEFFTRLLSILKTK